MVDTAARATPGAIVPDRPAALYTRGTTEDTPNPTNRNPAVAVTIFGKMTASNNPVAMTTPLICNDAQAFDGRGIWGSLSAWQDGAGTQWVLAPFWGPVHSKFKFEVTHGPVIAGGVGGFRLRDRNGKWLVIPD